MKTMGYKTVERRAVLVYQNGIANVFEVASFNMADYGRDAVRLHQHAFTACESFAQGLAAAGWYIASAVCDQTGDIAHAKWTDDLASGCFSDQFHPVFARVRKPDNFSTWTHESVN